MEPISTTAMISAVVGYLAKSFKDNKSVKDFFNEFTDAAIRDIKPIFLKPDDEPHETVKKLQQNPDSPAKQNAVIATIESEVEDQPALAQPLKALYEAIQNKQGNTFQFHSGSGDNVAGDKKTYNINKIDKADFH